MCDSFWCGEVVGDGGGSGGCVVWSGVVWCGVV